MANVTKLNNRAVIELLWQFCLIYGYIRQVEQIGKYKYYHSTFSINSISYPSGSLINAILEPFPVRSKGSYKYS